MSKRDCVRKIRHDTFYDAMVSMMKTLHTNPDDPKADQECCVYECIHCGSYHWGHKAAGKNVDPEQVLESLRQCQNIRQVDWVMSFYTRAIAKMQKDRHKGMRVRAMHIINLADYQRRFVLHGNP